MSVLNAVNLNIIYPKFKLDNVSFKNNEGRIVGFIGRNGAGKTTIKSLLNLIDIDSGETYFFGKSLKDNELFNKIHIGYSAGSISWYPRRKIKDLVAVVKNFYDSWNEDLYKECLRFFQIDENKTPLELSEGMKVKVNLLIALSHDAKVVILDEPTSGLNPFSRDELLDLFSKLKQKGVSILFSTHNISDIERCADDIIYISKGNIILSLTKDTFIKQHRKNNETLEEIFLRLERDKTNV